MRAHWFDRAGMHAQGDLARAEAISPCQAVQGMDAASQRAQGLLAHCEAQARKGQVAPRLLALVRLQACQLAGDVGQFERAIELGEQACATAPIDEPLGWQARAALAMNLAVAGHTQRAVDVMESVVRRVDEQAEPLALGDLWSSYAYVLNFANRRREAVAALRRAMDLAAQAGAVHAELVACNNLAIQQAVLGQQDAAIATGLRARDLAFESGATMDSHTNEVNLGMFLAGAGRYRESLAVLKKVSDYAREHAPGSALQCCAHEFLAEVWLALGRADRAAAELATVTLRGRAPGSTRVPARFVGPFGRPGRPARDPSALARGAPGQRRGDATAHGVAGLAERQPGLARRRSPGTV